MSAPKLIRHTCYTLACSDCGDDPWDEFTPHFPTEDAPCGAAAAIAPTAPNVGTR